MMKIFKIGSHDIRHHSIRQVVPKIPVKTWYGTLIWKKKVNAVYLKVDFIEENLTVYLTDEELVRWKLEFGDDINSHDDYVRFSKGNFYV